jgi:phosphoenolpyruvate carboxykinase (ATP)
VPTKILNPVNTWKDKDEFDKTARALVGMFQKNFAKFEVPGRCRRPRRAAPDVAACG